MRAVVVDAGRLRTMSLPDPVPSSTQVLVGVRAVGVNRADLAQRRGQYRHLGDAECQATGFEFAGQVVQVGSAVSRFVVGDRVMALASAACAELAVVDENVALPVPAGLSYDEAAAVPVAFMTGHDALVTRGGVRPGSDVLITAASSNVSLACHQIARRCGVRRIIATTRSRHHVDELTRLGTTHLIDQENFVDRVLDVTAGVGTAVTVDQVGGPVLADCLAATAAAGRYISVGRLGGKSAQVDLDLVAKRRLSIIGVTFRTRSVQEIGAIAQRMYADLGSAFEAGELIPVLDAIFPMSAVDRAQQYLVDGRPFGKVVIEIA
ncbi:zinc-binding dehydrogenase [Kribbella sp. NPDC049227]|uniref:zinc-binding dehydrogenase n=1 Tax=Kribbella sp. NPDC049227 TaxID=3364113 RepID=UPI00372373B8